MKPEKIRCSWAELNNHLSIEYHDNEWGIPCFDDNKLFEMLILEGAQAGLSWHLILNKRQNYKIAFDNFDPKKVGEYTEEKINELLNNDGIVRNKLKINSVVRNAKVFLKIQEEYGSFSDYIWSFTNNKIINNDYECFSQAPTKTELSFKISKDLKKEGMIFVGETIIYSYLQSIGIVNDHQRNCFCNKSSKKGVLNDRDR